MTEKQWYEDIPRDEIRDKHVRVTCEEGAIFEGRLKPDGPYAALGFKPFVGLKGRSSAYFEGFHVLERGSDDSWHLLIGITSVDLVWDERDWYRIDVKDVLHGDAVVVNGRLCTVDKAWPDDYHPQVVTDAPSRMLIDLSLISFALRRKAEVKVPMEPGYYRDRDGGFWKMWLYDEGNPIWQPVLVDIDTSHVSSSLEMERLMPLTPVHFESGRAA